MSNQLGDGGGGSRPHSHSDDRRLVRHEEEPSVDTRWQGAGYLSAHREVESEVVRRDFPREREQLTEERIPVRENDSGKVETLPDGSISVPLFEEELVVTKRTVLRERVIIRKETIAEWETVEAELRREHISFDTSDLPEGSVEVDDGA